MYLSVFVSIRCFVLCSCRHFEHSKGEFVHLLLLLFIINIDIKMIFSCHLFLVDMIPPTVLCPQDLTYNIDLETPSILVSWTEPTVSDNLGNVYLVSRSRDPGLFPAGRHQVVYVYRDDAGNERDCSFLIVVVKGTLSTLSIVVLRWFIIKTTIDVNPLFLSPCALGNLKGACCLRILSLWSIKSVCFEINMVGKII